VAIVAAVAAAGLAGALNGVVIARTGIQPFIVTLASMIGVRGLAKWLTNNQNIDIGFGRDLAAGFAAIFREKAIVIGAYIAAAALFSSSTPPPPLRTACPSGFPLHRDEREK